LVSEDSDPMTVGVALTVVGVVATIYYGRLALLRREYVRYDRGHPVHAGAAIPRLLVWRPIAFMSALRRTDELLDFLLSEHQDRRDISPAESAELSNWLVGALLHSATRISPFSQGKAHLFQFSGDWDPRSSECRRGLVTARVAGLFSRDQAAAVRRARLFVDEIPGAGESVAAASIRNASITMQSLERSTFPSSPEIELGATHLIAIPVTRPDWRRTPSGQFATVTIHLRYPLGFRALTMRLFRWKRYRLHRRAIAIQSRLDEVAAWYEASESHKHTSAPTRSRRKRVDDHG
jgi:hypothetical protein